MVDFADFTPAPEIKAKEPLPEFTPAEATPSDKPLDNAQGDDWMGVAKNFATSAIKGVSHIPGYIGDLRDTGDYLAARAAAALTGRSKEDAQKIVEEGRATKARAEKESPLVAKALSVIPDTRSAPSGAEVAAPILKQTGEYQPTTTWGRRGAEAVETALASLGPTGLRGAGAKMPVKMLPAAGVAGAAGGQLTETTGDPLYGLAAGVLAPAALSKGASMVQDHSIGPVTAGGRAGKAAEAYRSTFQDPNAALAKLSTDKPPLPSSPSTTGEVTGDAGALQAESLARAQRGKFEQGKIEQEGKQNKARVEALESLSPEEAKPEAVGKLFGDRMTDLNAQHSLAVAQAEATAEKAHAALPGAKTPEETGTALREAAQKRLDALKAQRAAAYAAVDPNGTLTARAAGHREVAQNLIDEFDPAVHQASPIADPVLKMAAEHPDNMYFNKLKDFDQTVTDAMARAKRDNDPGYRKLVELKGAVMDSMNNAVKNQHAYEMEAVNRGDMPLENTLGARLKNWVADWRERTAGDTVARAGGDDTGGARAVPGASGGKGPTGNGPGGDASPQGVPTEPNVDPEAAIRLEKAKAAHKQIAPLYTEGTLDKGLDTNGFAGQYKMGAGSIPAEAFPGGDKGYDRTSTWLKGANNAPEAVGALQDVATTRLREMMKNGSLDQKTLDAWKGKYGHSLRAIDEASPGFSQRFDSTAGATTALGDAVAARQAALKAAHTETAARFLGGNDPVTGQPRPVNVDTAKARMGEILGTKDAAEKVDALLAEIGHDPVALDGARRLGVDWMLEATGNAGRRGEERIVSGAKLGKLVRNNPEAIRKLYGDKGLELMQGIAGDLERSEDAFSKMRTPGSDTTSKIKPIIEGAAKHAAGHGAIAGALVFSALEGAFRLDFEHVAKVAGIGGGRALLGALRGAGIRSMNDVIEQAMLDPQKGRALLQAGIDAKGQADLTPVLRWLAALHGTTNQIEKRKERAAGGAVKIDHAAHAARLVNAAERARREQEDITEPLLDMPDDHIVRALSVAQRAI